MRRRKRWEADSGQSHDHMRINYDTLHMITPYDTPFHELLKNDTVTITNYNRINKLRKSFSFENDHPLMYHSIR